jgi:hypothetical protein
LLDAWVAHLRVFDWEFVCAPTPSRDRTLRELTVNVFNPYDLAPAAWDRGNLPWHPEDDPTRALGFESAEALSSWAADIARRFGEFLAVNEPDLEDPRRPISSPRGELEWGPFVSSQRWHAAFHYRQLVAFAELRGVRRPQGALELSTFAGLELPSEVF